MAVKKTASRSAASSPKARPRQRFAKGRRPFFFDDAAVDRLLAMVMALTGEVAVLRERLDTHERLAKKGKKASPENIEKYSPDPAVEDAREATRVAMLNRVFRIIAFNDDRRTEGEEAYQGLIEKFAEL
jgi:hypothetical protein